MVVCILLLTVRRDLHVHYRRTLPSAPPASALRKPPQRADYHHGVISPRTAFSRAPLRILPMEHSTCAVHRAVNACASHEQQIPGIYRFYACVLASRLTAFRTGFYRRCWNKTPPFARQHFTGYVSPSRHSRFLHVLHSVAHFTAFGYRVSLIVRAYPAAVSRRTRLFVAPYSWATCCCAPFSSLGAMVSAQTYTQSTPSIMVHVLRY